VALVLHNTPPASNRVFAIDAAAVVTVGAAICVASYQPVLMTAVVSSVVVLRFLAWLRLPVPERELSPLREVAFFALCTVLGAGNDWNSVVRHRVYDYTVPHWSANPHAIPFWMLLYWGLILRFVVTLCRWNKMAAPRFPAADIHLGSYITSSPYLKVIGEIALTVATRQMIYAYYLHPLLSWLPFAAALATYALVFRLAPHERALLMLAAIGGPVVEILFIQVGRLHRYHLGWFGGVPLWIILWWMLAVLVWNDLSARLLARLRDSAHG
jgi:hypothetical protein